MFYKENLKNALLLPDFDSISAQNKMAPNPRASVRPPDKEGDPNKGAVMLIIYNKDNNLNLLLIKRQENLKTHPGQISFPGGTHEDKETFLETALRETHEEVGIVPDNLEVLGNLNPVYIPPSDFVVYPFVSWHNRQPVCTPCHDEVAEIIEVPIKELLNNGSKSSEIRINKGAEITTPYFRIKEHKVWGATAMILSELLERFKSASIKDQ
jgi:8-oxo-dGTP pyrophosphatase MutT (NUDIX family)